MAKKFAGTERKKVDKRIRRGAKEHAGTGGWLKVAEEMRAEGFKMPDGSTPIQDKYIAQRGVQLGHKMRGRSKRQSKVPADHSSPKSNDSQALAQLVLDSKLPDAQKLRVLKGLLTTIILVLFMAPFAHADYDADLAQAQAMYDKAHSDAALANAVTSLSNFENRQRDNQAPKPQTCITRSRLNIYGVSELVMQCQ